MKEKKDYLIVVKDQKGVIGKGGEMLTYKKNSTT